MTTLRVNYVGGVFMTYICTCKCIHAPVLRWSRGWASYKMQNAKKTMSNMQKHVNKYRALWHWWNDSSWIFMANIHTSLHHNNECERSHRRKHLRQIRECFDYVQRHRKKSILLISNQITLHTATGEANRVYSIEVKHQICTDTNGWQLFPAWIVHITRAICCECLCKHLPCTFTSVWSGVV